MMTLADIIYVVAGDCFTWRNIFHHCGLAIHRKYLWYHSEVWWLMRGSPLRAVRTSQWLPPQKEQSKSCIFHLSGSLEVSRVVSWSRLFVPIDHSAYLHLPAFLILHTLIFLTSIFCSVGTSQGGLVFTVTILKSLKRAVSVLGALSCCRWQPVHLSPWLHWPVCLCPACRLGCLQSQRHCVLGKPLSCSLF